MPRAKEPAAGISTAQAQQDAVSDGIDNFELPRSLIMKLARASQVPENTKFSKEVILSMLKASTVFINYLAATAHEVASQKQHKSISATDVLKALELVEFGDIAKTIQGELQVYRDLQKADKRKSGKVKTKDGADSASAASKVKGKAKASGPSDTPQPTEGVIPPIHIPRLAVLSAAQTSGEPSSDAEVDQGRSEDVDEDQEVMMERDQEDVDDDMDDDVDEGEDDEEEDEEDEEQQEEEVDLMALEEKESRTRDLDKDDTKDD